MADSAGGLPRTANELIRDRAIAHAIMLMRARNGITRDVIAFLNAEVYPDMVERARKAIEKSPALTVPQIAKITESMREILKHGFAQSSELLTERLIDLGNAESAWQELSVRNAIPQAARNIITIDFDLPSPATLQAIVHTRPFEGRVLGDWWKGIAADTQQRVSKALKVGVAEGDSIKALVARIDGGDRSALGASRRNVEAVIRTAATHVANETRHETFEENAELFEGWQFVATLDSRTTLICAAEDGKVYKLGEGTPPPLHWGCRSTSCPVLKSWEKLGFPGLKELPPSTRASLNGQVSEKRTYEDWLRDQPAGVQEDILGTTRARLFRSGAPIGSFVDDRGKTIKIADLHAA